MSTSPRRPPGPGLLGPASLYRFQKDPLAFFTKLQRACGDIVSYRIGGTHFLLVTDPAVIEAVFMDSTGAFERDELMQSLSRITGQGLLSINGPLARKHRRLMSPSMRRTEVEVYAQSITDIARKHIEGWPAESTRDATADMMRLSMEIGAKCLLNLDIPDAVNDVMNGLDAAMDYFMKEFMGPWRMVPSGVPARHRRRFFAARKTLVNLIDQCIERRQQDPESGHDLLCLLLRARDEDNSCLSAEELRDEITSMFLAGHETTALALVYSLRAMACDTALQQRVREESLSVFRSEGNSAECYKHLRYTRAVLSESLRLYSPSWVVARQTTRNVDIGGYPMPQGTQVMMPPALVHRDPRWFEAPEEFRPERFLQPAPRPRFAYFPFGGGPRTCIGNHFALLSATLALATITSRVAVEPHGGHELTFAPSVTLRPKRAIQLKVRALPAVSVPTAEFSSPQASERPSAAP